MAEFTSFEDVTFLRQDLPVKQPQSLIAQPVVNASQGTESANNSSTTPLAGSATYTGTGEQNDLSDVMVSCQTDADGTLYFDFSVDGTNWTTFPTAGFTVTAGIHEFHTAVKGPRYFRVRLVNGSSAQTYLRLYTYFGLFRQGNLPIGAGIASDADATIVRSVSADLDLALGRFGGMEEDTKFGYVDGIDAADNAVDIWALATDTLTNRLDQKIFPTSASTLYIACDVDVAGNRNVEITVVYIDANGYEQTTTVNTDATDARTGVSLGVTGLDVNRAFISDDTKDLTGNLYVTNNSGFTAGVPSTMSNTLAFIPAGEGQTQQAMRTVPIDKTMRLKTLIVTIARASGAAGSAIVKLRVRKPNGSWLTKRRFNLSTGNLVKPVAGVVLEGGSQVRLVLDDVSDTDTNVTGEFAFDEVTA